MDQTSPTALRLPVRLDVRRGLTMSEALPYYLDYRKGKNKSQNTLAADEQCVRNLIKSIGDKRCSVITEEDIDNFFSDLAQRGMSERGRNNNLRGLRMFFQWVQLRDLRKGPTPPTVDRELFTIPETEKLYIPSTDFRAILEAARNPRDRIICALGLYLWQRQSEVVTLKIKDVYPREWLDADGVLRRGGRVDVKVHKTRQVDPSMPISQRLHEELTGWRSADGIWHQGWFDLYRKDQGVDELDPEWYLTPLLRKGHYRLTDELNRRLPGRHLLIPDQAPKKIHDCAKVAIGRIGYPTYKEGMHTLRRSGARALYQKLLAEGTHEGAIRVIMAMLHHKDPRTTEIYLGVMADRDKRDRILEGYDMFGEDDKPTVMPEEMTSGVIDLAARRAKRA